MSGSLTSLDLAQAAQTLQAAIHAAITDSPALEAGLGDPVRAYDDPPDASQYPYLTYGDVRSTDTGADGAPQSNHQISLHVWSRYRGRAEVLALMRNVQSVVERELGVSGTMSAFPVFLDVFRAADGITFHGLLRLSVTLSNGDTP